MIGDNDSVRRSGYIRFVIVLRWGAACVCAVDSRRRKAWRKGE